jgi:Domain of unknown function (DUF397)
MVWWKSSYSTGNNGNCVEVALWRKSSHSTGNNGNCVELAVSPLTTGVRDSKNSAGPILTFSHPAWAAFLNALASPIETR